jgi:hypothetical protein
LIELLVTVSIITLLVTILMPSLHRARELARRTVCVSNQRNTATAALLYAESSDEMLPPCRLYSHMNYLNFNHWVQWFYWVAKGWQNLGILYVNHDAEAEMLYCPSQAAERNSAYGHIIEQGIPPRTIEWRVDGTVWWPYSTEDPTWDGMRAGYSWNPRMRLAPGSDKDRRYQRSSDLSAGDILMCDEINGNTPHGDEARWHVTFGDASVSTTVDETIFTEEFQVPNFDRDIDAWDSVLDKLVAGR